jgi:uncharacterized protein (TIGR02246 family)
MNDDERAIRDLVATWMAASQAGDVETVLGLMADDVVFMVPGRAPFGKAAFAADAQAMKNVRFEGTHDIRELAVLGDWAYLRNYLTVTVTPPGGAPVRRAGYTLTILRKEPGGKWLLARDANLLTKVDGWPEMSVIRRIRRFGTIDWRIQTRCCPVPPRSLPCGLIIR